MIKERLEENKEFQHLKPKDNGKLQWNYHVKVNLWTNSSLFLIIGIKYTDWSFVSSRN